MRWAVSLALGITAQASCMQTGREWVHAPLDDGFDPRLQAEAPRAMTSPPAPPVESARGARRITKTITLGETTTPTTVRAADARTYGPPATTDAPYRDAYVVPYASRPPFTVGPSYRAPARWPADPARGESSVGLRPGQDWPKPPSYGPPFPYSTAPASPWR